MGHGFLPKQNAVLPCVCNECPGIISKAQPAAAHRRKADGATGECAHGTPSTTRLAWGLQKSGEQALGAVSPSAKTLGTPGGFKALLANGAFPQSTSLIVWPWPPSTSIQGAGQRQRAVRVLGSRATLGQLQIWFFNRAGPSRDNAQKKGRCDCMVLGGLCAEG